MLPLALFGPTSHGLRTGILSAPARIRQIGAPLLLFSVMSDNGGPSTVVSGSFIANDKGAQRRAARAGFGIAWLPEIQLIDDLRASRLFRPLRDYPSQREPVHIVYPSRGNLAPRSRVMMKFVAEQTRLISILLDHGAEVLT